MRLLDPDVTPLTDASLHPPDAPRTVQVAAAVGSRTAAASGAAELMLVEGAPGLVVASRSGVARVLAFRIEGGRIEAIADPKRFRRLDLRLLPPQADRIARTLPGRSRAGCQAPRPAFQRATRAPNTAGARPSPLTK